MAEDNTPAERSNEHGIERREFAKSALAVGGTSAISALAGFVVGDERFTFDPTAGGVLSSGGEETTAAGDEPLLTAAARNNRQHAWDAFEHTSPTGNSVPPANSIILLMDYQHEGEPLAEHRREVEGALRDLEGTFGWGAENIVFTLAYTASFFDRYEEDLPPGAKPTPPEEVVERAESITSDDDITADDHDAILLMASENVMNVLAAEEALWGETVDIDDDGNAEVDLKRTFEGIFSKPESHPDRRVGHGGPALPHDQYNEEILEGSREIPEDAPLSMGFVAGFDVSIPHEDIVTLREGQEFPSPAVEGSQRREPGVFAQGTLKHLSFVELDLNQWYGENTLEERRHRMFSPFHTEEGTGTVGKGLVDDPGGDPDAASSPDDPGEEFPARSTDGTGYAELTPQTAVEGSELTDGTPVVAHSQKTARARYDIDGDGEPEQPVLRRDWPAIAGDTAGYHFNVPMRFNEQIFNLLNSMHRIEFSSLDGEIGHTAPESEDWKENHGLVNVATATHRTNALVPPYKLRALPHPRALRVPIETDVEDDRVTVRIPDPETALQGGDIDIETVLFGYFRTVNKGVGSQPEQFGRDRGDLVFEFPLGETGLGPNKLKGRLFAKLAESRRPVVGTAEVDVPTSEDSHFG